MTLRSFMVVGLALVLSVMACGGHDDGPGGLDRTVGPAAAPSAEAAASGTGLSSLVISGATLSPIFSPAVTRYRAAVDVMSSTPFTITATPQNAAATVLVDGVHVEPGKPSQELHIPAPYNPIDVAVIAPYGGATTHYLLVAAAAQDAYIKASNTRSGQRFSNDIALSGNLLAVGAWGDASAATGINGDATDTSAPNSGAVHVYSLTNGGWQEEAYIKPSNTRADAYFGITVAIDGDTLAVGAQDESSAATGIDGNATDATAPGAGAAYVFRRSSSSSITTWTQEAYIKASNTRAGAGFGTAVSLHGDTLAIGSWTESSGATGVNSDQGDTSAPESGAAYVFVRNGTTWSQQAYVKASNTRSLARFGNSVAVDGNTLAVGSAGESSNAKGVNGNQADTSAPGTGAAYVFVRSGDSWTQQAYLKASNTSTSSNLTGGFSISIAVSGDTLAVGGFVEPSSATGTNGDSSDRSAPNAGAVYVYRRSGNTWAQEAYLKPPNTRSLALFGYSLALDGDNLVVGSCNESSNATGIDGSLNDTSSPNAGAAYLFTRAGGAWTQASYLKASNTRADALFGYSVAISATRIAVGSRFESSGATGVDGNQSDTSAPYAGAVYVFR